MKELHKDNNNQDFEKVNQDLTTELQTHIEYIRSYNEMAFFIFDGMTLFHFEQEVARRLERAEKILKALEAHGVDVSQLKLQVTALKN